MPEENAAGQQAAQPTGEAAGTQAPVQPTSPAPAPQTSGAPGTDWRNRYVGLQQRHQQTAEELTRVKALLDQGSQHAGTLEQQLTTAQTEQGTLSQSLEETQAQLAQAQQETQFWNLVSSEFQDLLPMARVLQRATDLDQQRLILQTAREAMGGSVQQQVVQQVAQQFAGVTPGTSTPAQQSQSQFPSKEDVLRGMERNQPGSAEYRKWKDIWDKHPENSPSVLNPNFVDPFASDWEKIRDADEMVVVQDLTLTQGPWAPGGQLNPRS